MKSTDCGSSTVPSVEKTSSSASVVAVTATTASSTEASSADLVGDVSSTFCFLGGVVGALPPRPGVPLTGAVVPRREGLGVVVVLAGVAAFAG